MLAFLQVVGSAGHFEDHDFEAVSYPVSLDTDLLFAKMVVLCIGVVAIASWEITKRGFRAYHEYHCASAPASRKSRELQHLRVKAAQAVQAELLASQVAAAAQQAHKSGYKVCHYPGGLVPLVRPSGRLCKKPRAVQLALHPDGSDLSMRPVGPVV